MEKIQELMSEIWKEHTGLIFIALGIFMLVGAIRRWKWMIDMKHQRIIHPFGFLTLLEDFFGEEGVRIGVIIISIITILGGIGLWYILSR